MKNKTFSLNLGKIIATSIFFYIAYCLLLRENDLHLSVSALIERSHQLTLNQHLFALGLIPIYIGFVIFGAAMLGIYCGDLLHKHVILRLKSKAKLAFKIKH
jgi:hypothetical protein